MSMYSTTENYEQVSSEGMAKAERGTHYFPLDVERE